MAEKLDMHFFMTLTLDPKKLGSDNPEFAVRYMRQTFNKFREYLRRKFDEAPRYICILEFHKSGRPHLHVLFDRYLEQHWISETWGALGGGRIVDIRSVSI